jgi:hypothetical protein
MPRLTFAVQLHSLRKIHVRLESLTYNAQADFRFSTSLTPEDPCQAGKPDLQYVAYLSHLLGHSTNSPHGCPIRIHSNLRKADNGNESRDCNDDDD